ncbi:glycosyltransferase family 39 protein [Nannocystis punicea]|uniref:Glycosyltransferase family 39 protein n=1 Tax=Nannocystis punicea TaxID=2995304 RepID=A0ABY7H2R7_9BACT|nr:glycosyltransferase family 39 protein [Nannocystis poenicansa]WAS93422.1 glycosyltransferase family 39 protein [Nannocystis poenicansa]
MKPLARTAALLVGLAALHLALAWPGAGERGVIAEEITPYLPRHPVVLASADAGGVRLLPPHDRPDRRGFVSTAQWPNLAYIGDARTWPVLIKGHQSALGTYLGLAAAPALGDGIAGVRRSSVLLGLVLVGLVFALARRLGLGLALAGAAALACVLSPGLLFFARTGYGFELASRVAMLAALVLAARPLTTARSLGLGLLVAAAILCRATIAATLLPALLLLLVHPDRRAGLRRPALALGLGAAVPLLFALVVQAAVPLHEGTAPAAKLPLADLAQRTATAPATLAAQLAWVADPDTVLLPLVADLSRSPLPGLVFGTAVLALALARWWRARAGDGECLFVAAALGNALFGAWLYGDPQQFQLGMALEPLFVLAVAHQLQSLRSPRLAGLAVAVLLGARAWQCGTLLTTERAVGNPMLSGESQRELVAALVERHPAPGDIVTTTYNHVGMLEAWAPHEMQSTHPPIHAYRALRRGRGDDSGAIAAWLAIFRAYPARFVVLSTGPNLFDGPFTDNEATGRALFSALPAAGRQIVARRDFTCESGDPCLALLELSPRP